MSALTPTPVWMQLKQTFHRLDAVLIRPLYPVWLSTSLVGVAGLWYGVLAGVSGKAVWPWWVVVSSLLLGLAVLGMSLLRGRWLRQPWIRPCLQGVLVLLVGVGARCLGHVFSQHHSSLASLQRPLDVAYHQQHCTASGYLRPNEQGWNLDTETLCGIPHTLTLKLKLPVRTPSAVPMDASWQAGQHLALAGRLSIPKSPQFTGDFNEVQYLASQHQWANFSVQRVQPSTPTPTLNEAWPQALERTINQGIYTSLKPWQEGFLKRLEEAYGKTPEAPLLGGMVLGNRTSPLPTDLNEAFLHTGQTHLIAASGMNIAIIAGALWLLGRSLGLAKAWQLPLTLLGVFAYCWMTGWPPSIKRAGMVWLLALCLRPLLPSTTPTLWLLWGVGLLACFDTACLLSLGFQLSVLTTLGLMQWLTWLEARYPATFPRFSWQWLAYGLRQSMATATIAQLWATPLILSTFQYLPLHSIAWNAISALVVVPVTFGGFILMGGVGLEQALGSCGTLGVWLSEGVYQLTLWLAAILKPLLQAFIGWTLYGDTLQQQWPWLSFYSLFPPQGWLGVGLVGLALPTLLGSFGVRWPQRIKHQGVMISVAVLLFVGWVWMLIPSQHPLVQASVQHLGDVELRIEPQEVVPIRLRLDEWPNRQQCQQLQQAVLRGNVIAYTQQGTPWELHIQQGRSRWPARGEADAFLAWVASLPRQSKANLILVLPPSTPSAWLKAPALVGVGWVKR